MTYANIDNATKRAYNKVVTLSEIITKRFYHTSKGHTKLEIKDIKLSELVSLIGGRGVDYERLLLNTIDYGDNFGIYERIAYNGKRWQYIAGQDYTSEMNLVRKLLREGK